MSIRQNSPVILNSFQDPCEVARPWPSVAFGSRRACTLKQGRHDGDEHSEHGVTGLRRRPVPVPAIDRLPDDQDSAVEMAADQRPMQRQRPFADRIGTLANRGQ
uniref:hypothetical protein n=1 Tax=Sphingomonas sp. TaxID=28214 RepID=UPI0025F96A0A